MDYSRQELVIGKKAQSLLAKKTVAIVGIGALGTVSAELLTRSGIGNLILIDRDIVEDSNLQRQILFTKNEVGKLKAMAAGEKLKKINSKVKIISLSIDLDSKNLSELRSDLVLDCTDNMETRFLIDYYCCKNKIPWIYASAIQNKGYVLCSVKNYPFTSIFKDAKSFETCETIGVLNAITSLIASIQTSEALKILLEKPHEKNLIHINLNTNEFKKLKILQKTSKDIIEKNYKKIVKNKNIVKYCSSGLYQFKGNFKNITKKKEFIKRKNMIIFSDRVLLTAKSEIEAKSLYSRFVGN